MGESQQIGRCNCSSSTLVAYGLASDSCFEVTLFFYRQNYTPTFTVNHMKNRLKDHVHAFLKL
jgi:hypothetical protein